MAKELLIGNGNLRIVFVETRFLPTPWQIQHGDTVLAEGSGMSNFLATAPRVVVELERSNQTEDAGYLRDLLIAYVQD